MKKLILVLTVILLLSCVPIPVFAAETIDSDSANGRLTVSLIDGHIPVVGAPVHIWKVADISGTTDNMIYSPTEKFEEYDFSFNFNDQSDWATLLNTLAGSYFGMNIISQGIIQTDSILSDYAAWSDASGKAVFNGLTPGVYVIVVSQFTYENHKYTFYPAIIILPYPKNPGDDSSKWEWTYDVQVSPKYAREPITTPDTTPPDTNPPDTNPPDTTPPDTTPPDTNPPDTNPPDTNPPDTTPPDTTPPDTNPPEIEPPEIDVPTEEIPLIFPPLTDVPETVPEEEIIIDVPKIPKSGLLWWPVPFLGIGGVGMIAGGAIISKSGKKDD